MPELAQSLLAKFTPTLGACTGFFRLRAQIVAAKRAELPVGCSEPGAQPGLTNHDQQETRHVNPGERQPPKKAGRTLLQETFKSPWGTYCKNAADEERDPPKEEDARMPRTELFIAWFHQSPSVLRFAYTVFYASVVASIRSSNGSAVVISRPVHTPLSHGCGT